jgi:hypothetical protein
MGDDVDDLLAVGTVGETNRLAVGPLGPAVGAAPGSIPLEAKSAPFSTEFQPAEHIVIDRIDINGLAVGQAINADMAIGGRSSSGDRRHCGGEDQRNAQSPPLRAVLREMRHTLKMAQQDSRWIVGKHGIDRSSAPRKGSLNEKGISIAPPWLTAALL